MPRSQSDPGLNASSSSGSLTGAYSNEDDDDENLESNCVAVIVECPVHHMFAVRPTVTPTGNEVMWLPMVRLSDEKLWANSIKQEMDTVFGSRYMNEPKLLSITHIKMTNAGQWTKRIIFRSQIPSSMISCGCKKPWGNMGWVPIQKVHEVVDEPSLWSHALSKAYNFKFPAYDTPKPGLTFLEMSIASGLHSSSDRIKSGSNSNPSSPVTPSNSVASVTASFSKKHLCARHRKHFIPLASHAVTINPNGVVNYKPIQETDLLKDRVEANKDMLEPNNPVNFLVDMIRQTYKDNFISNNDVEDVSSYSSTYMREQRAGKKKFKKETENWWNKDDGRAPESTLTNLRFLLDRAKKAFHDDNRILRIVSPCFVMGDTHGNLEDVMIFERALWKGCPGIHQCQFLFLGDFVDRGKYSVEVVTYLMCLKVLFPEKVHMVRGNHEVKSLQVSFTFKNECVKKFKKGLDESRGIHYWNLFNEVFDTMPVAATIDDRIFCSHGGIPATVTRINQLQKIPKTLDDPEFQSAAAWEILWNDPLSSRNVRDVMDLRGSMTEDGFMKRGYVMNEKRGTGFVFEDKALQSFLDENRLTHVIRAHEVAIEGFMVHFEGKAMTIFSSSNYQGAENAAGTVLVANKKLRLIQVSTPGSMRTR